MPRRNQPHPSLRKDKQPLEHGDPYVEENIEDLDDEEELEEDPDFSAERRAAAERDDPRFSQFQRENDVLRREIEDLRRRIPNPQAEVPVEEEPDWDQLIFSNPKEAVKLIREQTAKDVETKLRREYQADQGQTKFWSDFYAKHDDLADEDDIVQAILSANMATLGSMPVKQAMDELADLTRKRIMRYSNGKGRRPNDKTRVEGARSPSGKAPRAEPSKVVTLSDIIRNRRANRSKAASAA